MVTYSIKDLMSYCADYALDAQIQKILFSLDLWLPKAAREVHIENVAQQRYATPTAFSNSNRARSPNRNEELPASSLKHRSQRTFGSRSMSAEVFRGSSETGQPTAWRHDQASDRPKTSATAINPSLVKKSSNGLNLDDGLSASLSQIKLMPILEGGENEDKSGEPSQVRSKLAFTATTISWTPTENESSLGTDALFELSVRADTALKTALCENGSLLGQKRENSDRLTLRKSVSVMNQKQKTGSGRSLVRAKSDMVGADASRKRGLTHIARASERYFSDEPKTIADIEELEIEYLFNYIRHLKTFPKYAEMTEDEILEQVESDPHTLRQRTKEILKGKMSESYAAYIAKYPIKQQRRREHPTSPNKYRRCSRRCFDGQLRTWRRQLHQFDENNLEETEETAAIDTNQQTT